MQNRTLQSDLKASDLPNRGPETLLIVANSISSIFSWDVMKIEPVICVIGCFSLSLLTCIQNTFQYLSSDSITGELRAFPVSKREGTVSPECVMGKEKGKSQYPALVLPV